MADAERWGFPDHIKAALAKVVDEPSVCWVWPENIDAVLAFAAVATQWRTSGAGSGIVFIGLDYVAVRVGLRAAGMKCNPEIWSDIRIMEAEALSVLNKA